MFDTIRHENHHHHESKVLPRQTVVQSAADYHSTTAAVLRDMVGRGVLKTAHLEVKWACHLDRVYDDLRIVGRFCLNNETFTFEDSLRVCDLRIGEEGRRQILHVLFENVCRKLADVALRPLEKPLLDQIKLSFPQPW